MNKVWFLGISSENVKEREISNEVYYHIPEEVRHKMEYNIIRYEFDERK